MLLDEATTGITQSVQTGSRLVPSAQGTRAELDARGITGTWVQLKAATPGSAPVEGFKDVSRTDYLENRPPHGYEAIITAIDYVININTLKANTNLQEFQKMAFARQEGQNISQKALWEKLLPALNDSKISAALEVHNPGITQTLNALSTDKVADSEAIEWTME